MTITTDGMLRCIHQLPDRSVPSLRALRREFSRELRPASGAAVVALALDFRAHGLAWIGYELILHHKAAFAELDRETVERLGQGLGDWAGVDTFGTMIAGPAWKAGLIDDAAIQQWARSPDRWWRRAALVATVPLNTRETHSGDARRTLAVAALLIDDRDDMVVKAMSWALRALSVRDRAAAEQFLVENETRLAARVKRELRNKLRTGLKTPRRA